jgi:hypothetical protein
VAIKLVAAASRMVETKRSNGIYSSPFFETKFMKTFAAKALLFARDSLIDQELMSPTQALIRKRRKEGS